MSNQIDLRLGRFKKKKKLCQCKFQPISGDCGSLRRQSPLSAHSETILLSDSDQVETPFFLQALLWIRYATPSSLRLAICLQMNEGVSRTPYFTAHIHPEKMRMRERRRVNWLL